MVNHDHASHALQLWLFSGPSARLRRSVFFGFGMNLVKPGYFPWEGIQNLSLVMAVRRMADSASALTSIIHIPYLDAAPPFSCMNYILPSLDGALGVVEPLNI